MHGSGGGGYYYDTTSESESYRGSYSGYKWDSVYLTAGDYDYTLGAAVAGPNNFNTAGSNGNSTTFSTYTAEGGTGANYGNRNPTSKGNLTSTTARLKKYGLGGIGLSTMPESSKEGWSEPGGIYIEYLGY